MDIVSPYANDLIFSSKGGDPGLHCLKVAILSFHE